MQKQAKPLHKDSPHFREFWEKGNGKDLIEWSGAKPNIDDFDRYSHLYYSVDTLGEEAVRETYLKMPFPKATSLVMELLKEENPDKNKYPENLYKLIEEIKRPVDWYDLSVGNQGASLCMRSGTLALMALRDYSLMGGYDYAYLNKPLIFTGSLKKGPVKRMKDTLEFWVEVTRKNAFTSVDKAHELITRTRLMHGYSRLAIKEGYINWDYELWGEPINQWDMIATYMGFSLVLLHGLKKLGLEASPEEEEGLFHLWRMVGTKLGIATEFLPTSKKTATEQFYLWTMVQGAGDEDSKLLAHALLEENLINTIYPYQFQRKALYSLHQSISTYVLDSAVLERLGIPPKDSLHLFPGFLKGIGKLDNLLFPKSKLKNYLSMVERGDKIQQKVLRQYQMSTTSGKNS